MYACLHGQGNLIAIAQEFSPTVEATGPETVAFDIAGLTRLIGLPQDIAAAIARRLRETGIQASLAVADNPDAAICAARGFPGVSLMPHGDEAKFLATLPVTLLEPSLDLLETLERWGIRRFHELARGEAERKLRAIEDPLCFEEELELEDPVELLEPLAFLLSRLINGLAMRLATRALSTNELRLRLRLEDRSMHESVLRLPVPSLDTKAFLKLMQLELEAHPPIAPVVRLWMGMNPVKPQAAQNGLFLPVAPEPVKLELTIARIQAIVGQGRVGTPELVNTHRPDAFRLSRMGDARTSGVVSSTRPTRLSLRIFRPPRTAQVALASGQPSFVNAGGIRGRVVEYAGPWRTTGDWWTVDPWHRDEWDVALSDGALYRLFCSPNGWYVEGSYD